MRILKQDPESCFGCANIINKECRLIQITVDYYTTEAGFKSLLNAGKLKDHTFNIFLFKGAFCLIKFTMFISDCGKKKNSDSVLTVADCVKPVYHCMQSDSWLQVPEAVPVK